MHALLIALIISALVTAISLFTLTIKKEDQKSTGIKIFIISYISSAIVLFIMLKKETYPEMETGEADF